MRIYSAVVTLFLFSMIFLTGCGHGPVPFLPQNWSATEIQHHELDDVGGQARLQVLVMYSGASSVHAALRIVSPHKGPLFWDPAGGYGRDGSARAQRVRDVIVENPPTLAEYLVFRREIPTAATEIFEWRLPPQLSNTLYDILADGADGSHPNGKFNTRGIGMFCGANVSDFLSRFVRDIMLVQKVIYPHDLARQLYRQYPDRVIIVRDGRLQTYRPGAGTI